MGFEFSFFKNKDENKIIKRRDFEESDFMAIPKANGEDLSEDQVEIYKKITAKQEELNRLGDSNDRWANEQRAQYEADLDILKSQLKPKIY